MGVHALLSYFVDVTRRRVGVSVFVTDRRAEKAAATFTRTATGTGGNASPPRTFLTCKWRRVAYSTEGTSSDRRCRDEQKKKRGRIRNV